MRQSNRHKILTQNKPDRSRLTEIMNKSGDDRHDAEAQGDSWDIISGSKNLAQHVRRDFEDDIRDVENTQNSIVIVTFEAEILLETGQFSVANVCTIDEAKQVEEGDRWDDVKVYF